MLRLVPDDDRADRRAGEALQDLIVPILEGEEGKRLRRLQRAEADLRVCIEATGVQHLDDDQRVLLELERSLQPIGAVARIAAAPVLLLVLPSFLEDPRWQGDDHIDHRLRIDLTLRLARLCTQLLELADYDTDDEMEDVLDAWRVAHRRLRIHKLERARATSRLPPEHLASLAELRRRFGPYRYAEDDPGP